MGMAKCTTVVTRPISGGTIVDFEAALALTIQQFPQWYYVGHSLAFNSTALNFHGVVVLSQVPLNVETERK